MLETVFVRFGPYICHCVGGKRHIETRFVRLTGCGFYSRTRCHPRENNLRHTFSFQLSFQIGVRKSAPGAFCDEDVFGLLMQFGNQFAEVGGKLPVPSRLFCPPGSGPRDVNQNHRQLLLAKGPRQADSNDR